MAQTPLSEEIGYGPISVSERSNMVVIPLPAGSKTSTTEVICKLHSSNRKIHNSALCTYPGVHTGCIMHSNVTWLVIN